MHNQQAQLDAFIAEHGPPPSKGGAAFHPRKAEE